MNYLEFYGLNQEPFSNAPVGKFFYNSKQHSEALIRLKYAAESMKGLALLIGDIGTGKTTIARKMLDNLPEGEYESALLVIIHSGVTANWLLKKIAMQVGVKEPTNDKLQLLNQLYSRLVELHENNKKAVVLVDEAQMLQSKEIMEEFRGLLNLELPEKKLLTFIFFGLPEMEDYLKIDEPLSQRIALRYTLKSLDEHSTEEYIKYRLKIAGTEKILFNPEGLQSIHN
jgi:type II secretory pathway predicted ATPase ExeA